MTILRDGLTGAVRARVTETGSLKTFARNFDTAIEASVNGDSYTGTSGEITLTDSNETGAIYFKYTGLKNLIINNLAFSVEDSTGGSGVTTVNVYRNPTTGSLIDSGDGIIISNRNFSSNKLLNAEGTRGFVGATITDGEVIDTYNFNQGVGFVVIDISHAPFVIGTNASIAISVKSPPGNTSQKFVVTGFGYEFEENGV